MEVFDYDKCPRINLRTIFTKDPKELPTWIDSNDCIYMIKNLINDKCYIGQARWLYGRFVANGYTPHLSTYRSRCMIGYPNFHLYNALNKYKSKNFEVALLESNCTDLNDREVTWIKFFNSYKSGYNMTSGGDHREPWISAGRLACIKKYPNGNGASPQFRYHGNKEAREKLLELYPDTNGTPPQWGELGRIAAIESSIKNYNGDRMGQCHTEEARQKANATKTEKYGFTTAPMITEDANKNRIATMRSRYGVDYALHLESSKELAKINSHSPEALLKGKLTNESNHGGIRAWNTKESIRARVSTVVNGKLVRKTKLFISINRYLSELIASGLDINYTNYIKFVGNPDRHISRVLDCIDVMVLDDRWTSDMTKIFIDTYELRD